MGFQHHAGHFFTQFFFSGKQGLGEGEHILQPGGKQHNLTVGIHLERNKDVMLGQVIRTLGNRLMWQVAVVGLGNKKRRIARYRIEEVNALTVEGGHTRQ